MKKHYDDYGLATEVISRVMRSKDKGMYEGKVLRGGGVKEVTLTGTLKFGLSWYRAFSHIQYVQPSRTTLPFTVQKNTELEGVGYTKEGIQAVVRIRTAYVRREGREGYVSEYFYACAPRNQPKCTGVWGMRVHNAHA